MSECVCVCVRCVCECVSFCVCVCVWCVCACLCQWGWFVGRDPIFGQSQKHFLILHQIVYTSAGRYGTDVKDRLIRIFSRGGMRDVVGCVCVWGGGGTGETSRIWEKK